MSRVNISLILIPLPFHLHLNLFSSLLFWYGMSSSSSLFLHIYILSIFSIIYKPTKKNFMKNLELVWNINNKRESDIDGLDAFTRVQSWYSLITIITIIRVVSNGYYHFFIKIKKNHNYDVNVNVNFYRKIWSIRLC